MSHPLPAALLYSIEAEQAVLGAVLIDNTAAGPISVYLRAEHFYDPLHRTIYQAILNLIEGGYVATPVSVLPGVGQGQINDKVTVAEYLVRLVVSAPRVGGLGTMAELIRDFCAMRRVVAIGGDLAALLVGQPRERLARAFEMIDTVRAELAGADLRRAPISTVAGDLVARIERVRAGLAVDLFHKTGFSDLDGALQGGWYRGDLIIIGGRPGMGKTVLACCLALEGAKVDRSGKTGVLAYMLEIGEMQTAARMLAHRIYLDRAPLQYGRILSGKNLTDEDMWRLEEGLIKLKSLPLIIDDSSSLPLTQIVQRTAAEQVRMAKEGVELGPVVIDYMKFVKSSDRYAGQRTHEVGEISLGLKKMAKDLGVPVILLHQLNRGVEQQGRADRRPDLADLRDSGDLEADADVVIFPFREYYYLSRSADFRNNVEEVRLRASECEHDLELIVAKNRKGPTAVIKVWCDIGCSHISQRMVGH